VEEVRPGEVVLDLGSGPGLDCFLAAERVGPQGRVIGVDMTPEMIERAQSNARRSGFHNVEFRLGDIEDLPLADDSVDLVISNCVINLSLDKPRVFREAFRVLRPGGRIVVADIVLEGELPEPLRESVEAYTGCVAGALQRDEYLAALGSAGFECVEVLRETDYFGPARSITVRARKPPSPRNDSPDGSGPSGAQAGR
jgi:SAM-dependent methyltransferase